MQYNAKTVGKLFILILLIAGGVSLFKYTRMHEFTDPQMLVQMIREFGVWAPIIYILIYSVAPILAFPGSVLSLSGGLLFGPFLGTLYTVIGASIGATLAFLIARYFGRDFISRFERLHKGKLKQFDEGAEKNGFTAILILRLIPLVPFNALNYGAGLSKIRTRDYIMGTVIGIIPGTFAYNFLGGSLTNIFSTQGAIAIGVFVLVTAIPLLYKKFTS